MGGYLGASWWRRRPYWGWTRRTRTSTPWWKTWTKIVRQNYKLHAFTCSRGQWLKYHVKSVHSCGNHPFSLFGLGQNVNPIGNTMYRIKQRLVMQTLSQHHYLTTFSLIIRYWPFYFYWKTTVLFSFCLISCFSEISLCSWHRCDTIDLSIEYSVIYNDIKFI